VPVPECHKTSNVRSAVLDPANKLGQVMRNRFGKDKNAKQKHAKSSTHRKRCEDAMRLLKTLRVVMLVHVSTLLIQASFAGIMIGGDHRGVVLHEFTAKVLV
jgi:hypothetical protein